MDGIKIRRAPSGKFYAVWHGCPICRDDGNLRYFDTERDARDVLQGCDLVLCTRPSDAPRMSATSTRAGRPGEPLCPHTVPATKAHAGMSRLSVVR